ncbi:hypothetical protein [Actinoplanes rectilineatus]|uniref:hypothetical protein n=1 Tax=Actinoplanes rectilineatus TaxID=113571 RepID=UPI0005F2A954|nr:hypothetical protein [Actinoplanes rectilineatus]
MIIDILALALAAYVIGGGVLALLTGAPVVLKGTPAAWPSRRSAISFCFTFGGAILSGALVDMAREAGWIAPGVALWLLSLPVTLLLVAGIAFRPRRQSTTAEPALRNGG